MKNCHFQKKKSKRLYDLNQIEDKECLTTLFFLLLYDNDGNIDKNQ